MKARPATTPRSCGFGLRYGFILFIMSEVMFFSPGSGPSSSTACIRWGRTARKDGVWPPAGIETFDPWHLPFINTLILLLSGVRRDLGAPCACA
jgi:cytochrome c oxidase subunit 3